jgi:DNA-binding Lrp family transcriptional regulator
MDGIGCGEELLVLEPQARKARDKADINSKTVQLAELLTQIGPDINEISRRLGQYKESVRYRYQEKILGKGIAVQAAIDHEKLGLRRVVFIVEFADEYERYAQSILIAMSDLCYVTGFDLTMPDGSYMVNASVPVEFVGKYFDFLRMLETKGLFRCVKILAFDWFRTVPMRARFYDFETGRWDFDWSNPGKPEVWGYKPSGRSKFDYTDLLITKELRADANRTLMEMAEKFGIGYKKLAWHYRTHVKRRGLVRGYTLNWMGTRYDFKLEKALHRMHRYFAVDMLAEGLSEMERMEVMAKANALPFLWAEAGGENYWAQFVFPVDSMVEAYQYLTNVVRPVRDKVRLIVMDQTNALSFTISYKLFDEKMKAWVFDQEELLKKFGDLILKIRQGAG